MALVIGSDCARDRYGLIFVLYKVIISKAAELTLSTLNAIKTLEVYKHSAVIVLQHGTGDTLTYPFS